MAFEHIMLDIETLDTTSTAVVMSIGAVAFDPNTTELGDQFYIELTNDMDAQQSMGRTVSASTARWWVAQGALAQRVFNDTPAEGVIRVSTREGLQRFARFVEANGGERSAKIWGNGSDFDNVILSSLYERYGLATPWRFSNNRCYRTIRGTFGPKDWKVQRVGTHHNALDDAITQAVGLQDIFKCLKPQ